LWIRGGEKISLIILQDHERGYPEELVTYLRDPSRYNPWESIVKRETLRSRRKKKKERVHYIMEELETGFERNRRIKRILGKSRKKERKREERARKKATVKTTG